MPGCNIVFLSEKLFVFQLEMLNINRFLDFLSPLYRRFYELLACAEFAYGARFLEFSLEFLESSFDVLAFLDRNYNHNFITSFYFAPAKVVKLFFIQNFL